MPFVWQYSLHRSSAEGTKRAKSHGAAMTTPIATANTMNAFELRVISSLPLLAGGRGHRVAALRAFKPIWAFSSRGASDPALPD
jgi:hypothetical protein